MTEQTAGQRIRQVRQDLGLTQVQFAEMIGVTRVIVTRWETDQAVPSKTIVKFVELIATLKPGRDWIKLNAPLASGDEG